MGSLESTDALGNVSLEEARGLAEELFPKGPEGIADAMGVEVEYCSLKGTDGWCVEHAGKSAKIRINKDAVRARQRFTLAHEISHLLLGTDPEIVSNSILPFQSVRKEERRADQLAAELLIPAVHLSKFVNGVPIDAFTINKLSQKSGVSQMVAAGRIVAEAKELGLVNGALAVFKGDELQWTWSPTLQNVARAAKTLLAPAREALPKVFRKVGGSNAVTATVVMSAEYSVLLVQLLPANHAEKQTHHEVARELDSALFAGDDAFRRQFSGALGFFKSKAETMDIDSAIEMFNETYCRRWSEERADRLRSSDGQRYLRHRLSVWTDA